MYFINMREREGPKELKTTEQIKEPNPKFKTKTFKRNTAIIN